VGVSRSGHRCDTRRAPLTGYVLACLLLLSGCGLGTDNSAHPAGRVQFFDASAYPEKLSAWGLLQVDGDQLQVSTDNHVYDLNTALFTDYALKLRTVYMPAGSSASFQVQASFDLPNGSIIAKTFFYHTNAQKAVRLNADWDGNPASLDMNSVKLIETRLLVKQADGWHALPYIWRGDDAYLAITGDMFELPTSAGDDLIYVVPTRNQCASCHAENHTTGDLVPIGMKARHLHRQDPVNGANQLTAWHARGQLQGLPPLQTITANARMDDTQADLTHRARSYLDINCGHCHNPAGAADTSGLLLDVQTQEPGALGVCKPPIAAGRGSGGFLYSIVPGTADNSILTFRMSTTNPATMMPELGRSLVHREGLNLVSEWIDAMPGACL
jgi:uncharacterized repeat protein (TIGR03806 family)